jgi:ubiquitin C-terminal hydrolase
MIAFPPPFYFTSLPPSAATTYLIPFSLSIHPDGIATLDPTALRCLAQVETAPSVLVMQLKRFEFTAAGTRVKLSKRVSFPETLDLSRYMRSKSRPEGPYRLYGVLVHDGRSINSGHYYAYCCVGSSWCDHPPSNIS